MNWKNIFHQLPHTQSDILPQLMLTHLASWGAITMTGADKKTYLQGQVTCNVATLQPTQSTWGAHCDPKGKVWSLFRLFHHHEGYAMIQPLSVIKSECQELKKYAVFSQVDIQQSHDVVFGVIGQAAQEYINQLNPTPGDVRLIEGGTAIKISEQRWLLLLGETHAQNLVSAFTGETVDESVWMRFEIEDAFPLITASEQCQHIPQALNLQAIHGICFTKGCYTGQETIARAKYRGMNKRAMYIVRGNVNPSSENGLFDTRALTPNTPIALERAVGENWRLAGHLLACYTFTDHHAIGLIILPNNLEEGTPLRLAAQPETRWFVQPLPYPLHEED